MNSLRHRDMFHSSDGHLIKDILSFASFFYRAFLFFDTVRQDNAVAYNLAQRTRRFFSPMV